MAFATRRPDEGVIFHSDRGCQYTSGDYADLARANGVVLSVGCARANAGTTPWRRAFFATIKRELIDTRAWPTREGLRRAVFDYIEGWYNIRRLHSSLGYLQPRRIGSTSTTTPTVRRHDQHKQVVRRTGSSPGP